MSAPAGVQATLEPPSSATVRRVETLLRVRELGIAVAIALVFGVTLLKNHAFGGSDSVQQLLTGASLIMLLAVGETLVIVTRNVDLSVGSVVGFSAYVVGLLFVHHPGMPVFLGFVVGTLIGLGFGAINGLITTVLRVPSLVVTLAALYIIRGLDAVIVNGKQISPTAVPTAFNAIGYKTVLGVPWLFVIVTAVVLLTTYAMRSFRSARDLYAIGSNPEAAELAGVPTGRRIFAAFLISGGLAGLTGALFLAEFATVDAIGGVGYELSVVAAVVVGGVAIFGGSGTVIGAALGAILLNTINQALVAAKISAFWNQAIAGALLLAAIAFDRWLSLRVERRLVSAKGPAAMPETVQSRLRAGLLRWETALVLVLLATVVFGASESPNFLYTSNFFYIGLNMGEIAIMALPLTLIVITGEIDLSVASMLGLSSTLMGYLFAHGWPIWQCVIACLLVGMAGGALNGVLITRLALPSIAVTIGTLTMFRGIAEIVLGTQSVTGFPTGLTNLGVLPITGTQLSYSIAIFLALAAGYAVLLHLTPLGRSIYAIGLQSEAAHFSGIRVGAIKFWLFVFSGLVCSFAGVLWTLRFATSRYDAGTGLELTVVAIVLLGGVSIFGGRGTILGVGLAVAIVGCIQEALTLMNVAAQIQNIVTGALLLISVVVPNVPELSGRLRSTIRRRGRARG